MIRLLNADADRLWREWKDAAMHIAEASFRYEAFYLARIVASGRESHEQQRLTELMQEKPCKEPWFLELVRCHCDWKEE